jgi:hypothetical protein
MRNILAQQRHTPFLATLATADRVRFAPFVAMRRQALTTGRGSMEDRRGLI